MPSATIRRIAYEAESRTLSVWFRPSGRLYRYYDVPPDVHAAFRDSGAKGRFFNLRIRNRYPFRPIAEPDDDGRHAV